MENVVPNKTKVWVSTQMRLFGLYSQYLIVDSACSPINYNTIEVIVKAIRLFFFGSLAYPRLKTSDCNREQNTWKVNWNSPERRPSSAQTLSRLMKSCGKPHRTCALRARPGSCDPPGSWCRVRQCHRDRNPLGLYLVTR